MKRDDYDRLLIIAEHGDFSPEERLQFIEETESLADAPGGIHAALPNLQRRAKLMRRSRSPRAGYMQESVRLLQELD